MVQVLTYSTRHSHATRSNQHSVVKTPGRKLVYLSTKKRTGGPKWPVNGKMIQGQGIGVAWFCRYNLLIGTLVAPSFLGLNDH
ncbi:hypothetical protein SAY87_027539 [Trapa incisa]|uniref:Uncharacterized protein n=1 Tax=Trapa incisa TaxID=236973 RepID=A0AAN7JML3_9MYRT|nr:hypothetical protein SAY87_027539 [Trapa incisa]